MPTGQRQRFLAVRHSAELLAAAAEREITPERASSARKVEDGDPAELPLLLRLEEWHHPDLANGELPGGSRTFQQLAEVLATGEASRYQPVEVPNTHWTHWPDGGTL